MAARKVAIRTPEGAIGLIPEEQFSKAQEDGARLATRAELDEERTRKKRGTAGQQALAGLEGAVSSAVDVAAAPANLAVMAAEGITGNEVAPIMGGRDVLREGVELTAGEQAAQEYEQAARERAQVNPVTSTVGELAGGLAVGGAAGRAASGLSRLGKAAVFAAEGAAGGMSAAQQAAFVEGVELDGERALAATGIGALLGLGAFGAGSVLRRLSSKAAGKGGAVTVDASLEATQEVGEKGAAAKLRGFAEERAVKAMVGRNKRLFKKLTKNGADPEAVNRVGRRLLDEGVPIQDPEEAVAILAQKLDDATETMKHVTRKADMQGSGVNTTRMLTEVDDFVEKAFAKVRDPEAQRVGQRLSDRVSLLREAAEQGERVGVEELWDLRKNVDASVNWMAEPKAYNEGLKKVRRAFKNEIEASIKESGDDALLKEWQGAQQQYADYADVYKAAAGDKEAARYANRWISPSDYGIGVGTGAADLASGGGFSMAKGIAGAVAHKAVREKGSAYAAYISDRVADFIDGRISKTTGKILPKRPKLDVGPDAIERFGRERVRKPARALQIFGESRGERQKNFDETVESIRKIAGNDPAAVMRIASSTSKYAQLAPDQAAAAIMKAKNAAGFLVTKIPVPGSATAELFPQFRPQYVSDAEIETFARYFQGVNDPMSLLDSIDSGRVSQETVEAVSAVYPKLYNHMRMAVVKSLSQMKEPPKYEVAKSINAAFKIPAHPSLEPASVGKLQQLLASEGQPEQPTARPPTSQPSFSTDRMTSIQRLQRGMEGQS